MGISMDAREKNRASQQLYERKQNVPSKKKTEKAIIIIHYDETSSVLILRFWVFILNSISIPPLQYTIRLADGKPPYKVKNNNIADLLKFSSSSTKSGKKSSALPGPLKPSPKKKSLYTLTPNTLPYDNTYLF